MQFSSKSQIKLKIDTYDEKNLPQDIKNIPAEKPGSRKVTQ